MSNATITLESCGQPALGEALALAERALSFESSFALALPAIRDPLTVHLPPLASGGGVYGIAAETLRALAGLYLLAQLEQTGLLRVATALAQTAEDLPLHSRAAVDRLTRYRDRFLVRDTLDDASRDRLFARLFGIGAGARNEDGSMANREFETRFALFCDALVRLHAPILPPGYGAPGDVSPAAREMAVRENGRMVLENLSLRQYGGTVTYAPRLFDRTREALGMLGDPEIGAVYVPGAGGNVWRTLGAILGDHAPNFDSLLSRGQNGQKLLLFLAAAQGPMAGASGALPPTAEAENAAARWLAASGFDINARPATG